MFDHWRLKDFAPGGGVALGAFTEQFDTDDWIDVAVPGDVHQALVAAGRIPDPFYDRNELDCAWVEEREWWYRSQFTYEHGPPQSQERLLLVFHGLDTFVTIWLNADACRPTSSITTVPRWITTTKTTPRPRAIT